MMDFLLLVQQKITQSILVLSSIFAFQASTTSNLPLPTPTKAATSTVVTLTTATSTTTKVPQKPSVKIPTSSNPKIPLKIPVKTPISSSTTLSISLVQAFSTTSSIERERLSRQSIVNIYCTTKNPSIFPPITGSGVIIDPKGVILTNAHIGQYFLLKDIPEKDFVSCKIRTGSPAVAKYTAKPLYVSTNWVKENSAILHTSEPKGTGENDFALLFIDAANSPISFEYLPPETANPPQKNASVLVGAYAAGFLGGIEISQNIYGTFTYTTVENRYTFTEDSTDLLLLKGNIAAQKGSSGGGVINMENKLVGLVSTVSDGKTTDERTLGAITLLHINNRIIDEQGISLEDLLGKTREDVERRATQFQLFIAPELQQTIITGLSR